MSISKNEGIHELWSVYAREGEGYTSILKNEDIKNLLMKGVLETERDVQIFETIAIDLGEMDVYSETFDLSRYMTDFEKEFDEEYKKIHVEAYYYKYALKDGKVLGMKEEIDFDRIAYYKGRSDEVDDIREMIPYPQRLRYFSDITEEEISPDYVKDIIGRMEIADKYQNIIPYLTFYEVSSPIVSENEKYVIIHELMDESRKNLVLNSVLYRPDNGTFMFVDTGNGIYLEYGDFEQVKQYMSREEIDKFEKVRQETQQDKEMAEAWYGRHRIGRETDLQQPGDIWTETHEALREYGPNEFGDPIRLISDDEMER